MPDFNADFRADLHTHTYYSDGVLSPERLIQDAMKAGLQALSITDHDTVAAYASAIPIAQTLGLRLLTGIELSAHYEKHSVHILAYGFDITHPALLAVCDDVIQAREQRNQAILKKLQNHHILIGEDELRATFPQGQLGRPHMAQLMIKKGYVKDLKTAFTRYLGEHGLCAVPLDQLSVIGAIDCIHEAGGFAVLAHPYCLDKRLLPILLDLSSTFDGLETDYASTSADLKRPMQALAEQHQLMMTGGSDFHGIGAYEKLGSSFTSRSVFEKLSKQSV